MAGIVFDGFEGLPKVMAVEIHVTGSVVEPGVPRELFNLQYVMYGPENR